MDQMEWKMGDHGHEAVAPGCGVNYGGADVGSDV